MPDSRNIRPLSPPSIAPPAANYAHGMWVPGGADLVFTAGVVPTGPEGSVPDAIADQAETVWANIAAILRDADMGFDDVVSVTTYVVSGNDVGPVMAVRDSVLGGRAVASTLIYVPALVRPEWRCEIAVVAAKASGTGRAEGRDGSQ